MRSNRKIKVIMLQELVPPYRVPLFNQIARSNQVSLNILQLTPGTDNKSEWLKLEQQHLFNIIQLRGIHIRISYERFIHINLNLFFQLIKIKPDIIIIGGFNLSSLQSVFFARLFNLPVILWNESTKYTELNVSLFRKKLRQFILKKVNTVLAAGRMAVEYLKSLNVEFTKNIKIFYNSVDNDYYKIKIKQLKNSPEIVEFKAKYNKKIILFIGQLIKRKGVWEMLHSYREVYASDNDVALIILGSGKLLQPLKKYCIEHQLNQVYFEGFVHQDEAVKYFAIADVLLLLSHYDCNPLVILEALACGLPIVSSYQVGNTPEFVINEKNGYVVNGEDINQVKKSLIEIMNNEKKQKQYSEYSLELSEKAHYKKSAEVFINAVKELV